MTGSPGDSAKGPRGYTPKRYAYIDKCDFCSEMRSFLVVQEPDRWPDLEPKAFYTDGRYKRKETPSAEKQEERRGKWN